jgi:hypothetical protein
MQFTAFSSDLMRLSINVSGSMTYTKAASTLVSLIWT